MRQKLNPCNKFIKILKMNQRALFQSGLKNLKIPDPPPCCFAAPRRFAPQLVHPHVTFVHPVLLFLPNTMRHEEIEFNSPQIVHRTLSPCNHESLQIWHLFQGDICDVREGPVRVALLYFHGVVVVLSIHTKKFLKQPLTQRQLGPLSLFS